MSLHTPVNQKLQGNPILHANQNNCHLLTCSLLQLALLGIRSDIFCSSSLPQSIYCTIHWPSLRMSVMIAGYTTPSSEYLAQQLSPTSHWKANNTESHRSWLINANEALCMYRYLFRIGLHSSSSSIHCAFRFFRLVLFLFGLKWFKTFIGFVHLIGS